jgi:hypothetical protein
MVFVDKKLRWDYMELAGMTCDWTRVARLG